MAENSPHFQQMVTGVVARSLFTSKRRISEGGELAEIWLLGVLRWRYLFWRDKFCAFSVIHFPWISTTAMLRPVSVDESLFNWSYTAGSWFNSRL